MVKKIYKYSFSVAGEIYIDMPKDAHVLTVQMQGETACVWALVNPEASIERKTFRLYGTGHPIEAKDSEKRFDYVGTFQLQGGRFVFHLFEV